MPTSDWANSTVSNCWRAPRARRPHHEQLLDVGHEGLRQELLGPTGYRPDQAAAFTGGVVGAHYATSKAGLHGLMHHLAPRVAADGVTVNSLAPALVGETKMFPADLETGTPPIPIPVGRIGRPEEVASVIALNEAVGYVS